MTPFAESMIRRTAYAEAHRDNPEAQALEMQKCARDPVLWFNRWVMAFDPQLDFSNVPFDLWPKQEELVRWLWDREHNRESGVVEKSREAGASYICCGYALHRWLFRAGCVICFASSKLDLVDRRDDPKSLFHKIRAILYRLPAWMLPRGFDRKTNDQEAKLTNPANGSAVTGEGGDNIGMGGRATIYFVDEAARLERPELADVALSQTTRCRIDVSTPNGPGNPFARKRFSGNLPVFTLHWKDDPRKNRGETLPDGRVIYPWYEAEKKRLVERSIIASQLDIDYTDSLEDVCIPGAWVRAAVELDLPPSGPCVAGLDVAEMGSAECVFVSRRGPLVDHPRSWRDMDTTQTAHLAADAAGRLGVVLVCYDADGMGAGVRAAFRATERPLRFMVRPVRGGAAASDARWPDGRLGRERFVNFRAELWWTLRARFEKAHAHVERGERFPPEEMISIPNDPRLIVDLSLPRFFVRETGKVQIEAKADMRRRGVKSPDFADALAYSFAPGVAPQGYAAGGERREFTPPGLDAPTGRRPRRRPAPRGRRIAAIWRPTRRTWDVDAERGADESRLAEIEARAANAAFFVAACEDVPALCAEVRRLKALVESLAARVAAQSELLSRRAERPAE